MKAIILNKFSKMSFVGVEYDFGWLLPVAGKTVADYMVKSLKKSGIKDIFLCGKLSAGYDDGILYEYGRLGVKLCKSFDKSYFMKDSVIVIEKVGIGDFSFNEIIDFHIKNRALITCVQNKNSASGVIENTGIYFIEPSMIHILDEVSEKVNLSDITAGKKFTEFGKRIANYEIFDSWRSIEDKKSYIQANIGLVSTDKCFGNGNFIKEGVFMGKNSMVADSAVLIPPVMIGENCIVGSGCSLSGSVIGNNVILESDTTVVNSVLMDNISAGNHIRIKDSVISDGAKLGDSFKADDCVVGKRSVCKVASAVIHGASVASNTVIEKGCVVNAGSDNCRLDIPEFDEYGMKFDFCGKSLLPEIFAKLGSSLGSFYGFTSTVIVGSDSDDLSRMCLRALSSGLMFSGVNVKTVDDAVLPVMRWICRQGLADGGVYISGNDTETIYILNNRGNDITGAERNKVKKIYSCNGITEMPQTLIGKNTDMLNPEEFYTAHISDIFSEAYKCFKLGTGNIKGEIKDIVCAVMVAKMFPDAPVFVPNKAFLAVSKILEGHQNIIRCSDIRGDIMAEMERFIGIPGVYQQYLMMFDDFAFELGVSHFKALFGLEEIRKIVIPRVFHKKVFIRCKENDENAFFDYLSGNKNVRKNFDVGESLLCNNREGTVSVMTNSVKNGIDINIDSYREAYADEITAEFERLFMDYSRK